MKRLLHCILATALAAPAAGQCETASFTSSPRPNRFGSDVLISGDRMFIGDQVAFGEAMGAIYVYLAVDGQWVQESVIRPDWPELGRFWGDYFANEGDDTLFVGDFSPADSPPFSGRCEVLRREGTAWIRSATLRPAIP